MLWLLHYLEAELGEPLLSGGFLLRSIIFWMTRRVNCDARKNSWVCGFPWQVEAALGCLGKFLSKALSGQGREPGICQQLRQKMPRPGAPAR